MNPGIPRVPGLLLGALIYWAASASCMAGAPLDALAVIAALMLPVVIIGAVSYFALRRRHRWAALGCALIIAACAGAIAGCSAAQGWLTTEASLSSIGAADYRFVAMEDARKGDFGYSCTARVKGGPLDGAEIRLELPDDGSVRCWDVITSHTTIKPPTTTAREYYRCNGLVGRATVYAHHVSAPAGVVGVLSDIRKRGIALCSQWSTQGSQLIRALVFADRSDLLSGTLYGEVKTIGLAHIVAVSGAHLMVLVMFVGFVCRSIRMPQSGTVVVTLIFIVGYLILTGSPKSALRAACMAACGICACVAKRRRATLQAIALVIIVMLTFDPYLCISVSFTLSVLATLGIVMGSGFIGSWFAYLSRGHIRSVTDTLGMTTAANIFTLPVTIPLFGQIPLLAGFANVVIAPVFVVLCLGGFLSCAAMIAFPSYSHAIGSPMMVCAQATCEIIHALASIPYACVPATGSIPVYLALVVSVVGIVYHLQPQPSTRGWVVVVVGICAAGLCIGIVAPAAAGNQIIALDVGQGDAVVVRSGSKTLLVDTGTNDAQVLAGLARHHIYHIDAVLITHPDDDHCGSLPALLAAVPIDCVLVDEDFLTCGSDNCVKVLRQCDGQNVRGVSLGTRIDIGALSATVISPEAYTDEGGNADSVVLDVSCDADGDGIGETSALLCGDAEAPVLDELAEAGRLPDVDILKVGHHGSKIGVDDQSMSTMTPAISLISVGKGNRYGHPTDECLNILQAGGSSIFRTDEQGDIVCSLAADGITVTTLR